jgi:hypothetical protein
VAGMMVMEAALRMRKKSKAATWIDDISSFGLGSVGLKLTSKSNQRNEKQGSVCHV